VRIEGAVDGIRHQGTPQMWWINNVLECSGETYMELISVGISRDHMGEIVMGFLTASDVELLT